MSERSHDSITEHRVEQPLLELSADQFHLMGELKPEELTVENLDHLGLPVGEGVVDVFVDGEKRSINISLEDYGTALRPDAKEVEEVVEKLGLDNNELNLLGQFVHVSTEVARQNPGISSDALDAVVDTNYRHALDGVEYGTGNKVMARILATLIAAGGRERPEDAYILLEQAGSELVKLVGEEHANNLNVAFYEAINMKSYPDVTQDEKDQYLSNKFMGGASDIAEKYPKVAAAALAFGAGSTIRSPYASHRFMSSLADISHYDQRK